MYLEISARQSGKTTRLINNIINRAKAGEHCIVFGMNGRWTNKIKTVINRELTHKTAWNKPFTYTPPQYFSSYNQYKTSLWGAPKEKHYYYYDEFDYYANRIPNRIPDSVIISDTGYYATTVMRRRTINDKFQHEIGAQYDVLLDLVQKNNGKVISYEPINNGFDRIIELKHMMSPEDFNIEYLGIWKSGS